ncbi:MAG: hypothetical protein J5764_01490 [Bacteroidales bacterium]|nr:hypothetical protein [Bacteroidales bacterium]
MKDIEEFLQNTRPQVKEDPTFILETRRRIDQVEGLKAEMDRQRRHGRRLLIFTLAAGLVIGVVATAVAFLYPIDAELVFPQSYRQYLLLPVAVIAITLGLVLSRTRSFS